MHKNAYFNYISVLYRSKSFWHLFTELDCRKQKGILASWYIIELPDPLNSAHMNVEMLITGEQRGLIWRGLLFAGSCFSLSNKMMTKFLWILSGYNLIITALHHNKAEEEKKALFRLHQKHFGKGSRHLHISDFTWDDSDWKMFFWGASCNIDGISLRWYHPAVHPWH